MNGAMTVLLSVSTLPRAYKQPNRTLEYFYSRQAYNQLQV